MNSSNTTQKNLIHYAVQVTTKLGAKVARIDTLCTTESQAVRFAKSRLYKTGHLAHLYQYKPVDRKIQSWVD